MFAPEKWWLEGRRSGFLGREPSGLFRGELSNFHEKILGAYKRQIRSLPKGKSRIFSAKKHSPFFSRPIAIPNHSIKTSISSLVGKQNWGAKKLSHEKKSTNLVHGENKAPKMWKTKKLQKSHFPQSPSFYIMIGHCFFKMTRVNGSHLRFSPISEAPGQCVRLVFGSHSSDPNVWSNSQRNP